MKPEWRHRVVVAHAGRQHSYQTALAIQRAGALRCFITSSYYKRDSLPDRLAIPFPTVDNWLLRRHQFGLDEKQVDRHPFLELPELFMRSCLRLKPSSEKLIRLRDRKFDYMVSRKLSRISCDIVWGFQGSCELTVRVAKDLGVFSIAELTSVPRSTALRLMETDPNADLHGRRGLVHPSDNAPLADPDLHIVASTFAQRCLVDEGVPSQKTRVIPLGVDCDQFVFHPRRNRDTKLRLLFVGKVARHKGLKYLFEALERLGKKITSTSIVGPIIDPVLLQEGRLVGVEFQGQKSGADLLSQFYEHDVLVMPSIYEGFGFVMLEAMATGMPVIVTENSSGPDIVRQGVDGFVVPAKNSDAIGKYLEYFDTNRSMIEIMGRNAGARAREYSWSRYGTRVASVLEELRSQ